MGLKGIPESIDLITQVVTAHLLVNTYLSPYTQYQPIRTLSTHVSVILVYGITIIHAIDLGEKVKNLTAFQFYLD